MLRNHSLLDHFSALSIFSECLTVERTLSAIIELKKILPPEVMCFLLSHPIYNVLGTALCELLKAGVMQMKNVRSKWIVKYTDLSACNLL